MDVPLSTAASSGLEQKAVSAFETWFRQPSTITGLATIAGGLASGVVQVAAHQASLSAVAGAAVFALYHLVVSDNTAKL